MIWLCAYWSELHVCFLTYMLQLHVYMVIHPSSCHLTCEAESISISSDLIFKRRLRRVNSLYAVGCSGLLSHLSFLSMSPRSRLLQRPRGALSRSAGPTASRRACRRHVPWRWRVSRPVCGCRTQPLWSSVRSCESLNTPSLPLTDTRATAHVHCKRHTHAHYC